MSAPAFAVQRFVAPPPADVNSGTCTASEPPCTLQRALNDVALDGDEVIVNPGTYTETDPVSVSSILNVHGAAGQPRPKIVSSGFTGVGVGNSFAVVSDLEIEHSGGGSGLAATGGIAERIFVKSTGASACATISGSTVRDSVCWNTASSGAGVALDLVR